MKWSALRRARGPTSNWYYRESADGQYVARRVVSQYGLGTSILALRRDGQGNLTIFVGKRFHSLETAIAACELDAQRNSTRIDRCQNGDRQRVARYRSTLKAEIANG
jgi:hypothetical protein